MTERQAKQSQRHDRGASKEEPEHDREASKAEPEHDREASTDEPQHDREASSEELTSRQGGKQQQEGGQGQQRIRRSAPGVQYTARQGQAFTFAINCRSDRGERINTSYVREDLTRHSSYSPDREACKQDSTVSKKEATHIQAEMRATASQCKQIFNNEASISLERQAERRANVKTGEQAKKSRNMTRGQANLPEHGPEHDGEAS
jgi:hypothetical protein